MNKIEPYQYFRNYFTHTECILEYKYVKSINTKPYPVTLDGKREKILVIPTKKYIPVAQIGPKVITPEANTTCYAQTTQLNSHVAEVTDRQPTIQTQNFEIEAKQHKAEVIALQTSEKDKNPQTKESEINISKDTTSDVEEISYTNKQTKGSKMLYLSIAVLTIGFSIKCILK